MTRRLLLIAPPFYRLHKDTFFLGGVPLGIAYLAESVDRQTDWEVTAYNADFNLKHREPLQQAYLNGPGFENYRRLLGDLSAPIWSEVESVLREVRPNVVGISTMSQTFGSACRVAELAKRYDPDVPVIVGGPHPSMVGADVLAEENIDYFVRGEGEVALVEFLRALERSDEVDGVAGLGYRRNGRVFEADNQGYIEDLDTLGYPHEVLSRVLWGYEEHPPDALGYVFATRGCPFRCAFCGSRYIWGGKVRFRSPENVVGEIQGLQRLGLSDIYFHDDTFGITRQYLRDLCEAVRDGCPGLTWGCEIHVKLVDAEIMGWMREAGCTRVCLGVESGNNEVLRANNKKITIEEALAACRTIKQAGINLSAFFMIGFPQDTEDSIRDTARAIERSGADFAIFSIFTPYQGTETYELCTQLGLIPENFDVSLYSHQSPENCFCKAIPPERFRQITAEFARRVDRYNARQQWKARIRGGLTWRGLKRLPGRVLRRLGTSKT